MLSQFAIDSPLLAIALRIGGALLALLVGRWLARRARRWAAHLVQRTEISHYLEELAIRATYYGIMGLAVLTALAFLGVPVTAILTILGVALVILGIALQESISNFAATVIFFIFQPFGVGDYIETSGVEGTVEEIQLFNTVISKADGKKAVLPNGKIQEQGLINYSQNPVMRVACSVGVGYQEDLVHARQVARKILASDARILDDPAPQVIIQELGDSAIQMDVRGFVNNEDYWAVNWDLPELIKTGFDEAGIAIPYPQLDIHLDPPAKS